MAKRSAPPPGGDSKKREAASPHFEVEEIIFSGSTYQVALSLGRGKGSVFIFFHFVQEELQDAFCSCEEVYCPHLEKALEGLYPEGETLPLHMLFERSFWKKITLLFAEQLGSDPKVEFVKGSAEIKNSEISLRVKGSKKATSILKSLFTNRQQETPENSIKFSNLSTEEIDHWREGRPSFALRYELSFWSELAKWAFLLQMKSGVREVSFPKGPSGKPEGLKVVLDELEFDFTLTSSMLESLIESLPTLTHELIVDLDGEEEIEEIVYDKKSKSLKIERKKKQLWEGASEEIYIGKWLFVEGVGFFHRDKDSPLFREKIEESEVDEVLLSHGHVIARHLKGAQVFFETRPLNFQLSFDQSWNLLIRSYLFEEGDLLAEDSHLFGNWAYLDGKGFFPIRNGLFREPEVTVLEKEVSRFTNDHKLFLNEQPGFAIHLTGLETRVGYAITERFSLTFTFDLESGQHDFGDYVYSKAAGFFLKRIGRLSAVLHSGLEIPEASVSQFIQTYREELELLSNFFSVKNPLAKKGLSLTLENRELVISPEIQLIDEFKERSYHLFDRFIFVRGAGFHEIPKELAIPLRYQAGLTFKKEEMAEFFDEEFSQLVPFLTHIDPELAPPERFSLQIRSISEIKRGTLALKIDFVSERGSISLFDLWQAIHKKESNLFTKAGRIDLKKEPFLWLHSLKKSHPEKKELVLSTIDFIKLDAEGLLSAEGGGAEIERRLAELREFKTHVQPNFSGLKSTLRPYQETGAAWLWFLYQNGLSGLLCDEMGLGKTHQAMALVQAVMNEKPSLVLIVAPTSVIYHWQNKLSEFLPNTPCFLFHGQKRDAASLPKRGIILTSYGILRIEKELLGSLHFDMSIYDEIQVAKNAKSRLHGALTHIDSDFRLGLTGTPIENTLRELKSLFDIVLPSYLPGETKFREEFLVPIEKAENPAKKMLLLRLVRPFILRRRKKEVLFDLPEKSEDKFYADLSEEQHSLYLAALESARSSISSLYDENADIPYIHIFALLSQLKQICNHPALLLKDPKNYKKHSSGKWELFVELLEEALASEQKVVVFSQYLYMLDIIELYLAERSIGFTGIRGDTLKREEALVRFQNDPSCRVFVGSLQAAGLGIDLTSASNVILYDRWWNPARENQAIDRVHRIGQKWGVQVYKLLTTNTIEERIDAIIESKTRLIEEMLPSDDEKTIKSFTRSEMLELLSYTGDKKG